LHCRKLEEGSPYCLMPEPTDPVSNQRLEREPGPLRAIFYSNAREISLTERGTDYRVSWLFEEFQIGMCPGLMSVRTRTPEVLPRVTVKGVLTRRISCKENPQSISMRFACSPEASPPLFMSSPTRQSSRRFRERCNSSRKRAKRDRIRSLYRNKCWIH
jgi:hypothetical protein